MAIVNAGNTRLTSVFLIPQLESIQWGGGGVGQGRESQRTCLQPQQFGHKSNSISDVNRYKVASILISTSLRAVLKLEQQGSIFFVLISCGKTFFYTYLVQCCHSGVTITRILLTIKTKIISLSFFIITVL